ncbi:MAG: murein biosynthesis integral membrane protein MurJ [Minisyncoccia bacterium]
MKRITAFIHKGFTDIGQAALVISLLGLLTQLLGFVRDRSLAHVLGPTQILDIYYTAFRIPDFLFNSIATLVSVTILLPFLANHLKEDENRINAKKFLSDMASFFALLIACVSVVVFFAMPYIAKIIAPQYSAVDIKTLVSISRIMLLSPVFLGFSNIFGIVTQYYKQYALWSCAPLVYNLGIVFGVMVLFPYFGLAGLAWGVVLGAVGHMALQIPAVKKHNLFPSFQKYSWATIKTVFMQAIPRTIALSLNSLVLIWIVSFASKFGVGSVSLFTFALTVQMVPVSMIGLSFAVASFPHLAKSHAENAHENFYNTAHNVTDKIFFWSLPASIVFFIFRTQIVYIFLGSYKFTYAHARVTGAALGIFVLSLATQGILYVLIRMYYAVGNTKQPLIVNSVSAAALVALIYVGYQATLYMPKFVLMLTSLFGISGLPHANMIVLPLAYTVGEYVNLGLMYVSIKKHFPRYGIKSILNHRADVLGAGILLAVVLYGGLHMSYSLVPSVISAKTELARILVVGLVGGLLWSVLLMFTKNKHIVPLWKKIRIVK